MKTRLLYAILAACVVFIATAASAAQAISGRVVGVHDGDTITVLTQDNEQIKVRLAEIDAPELDQPYGKKAKQTLSGLVFGKDISIVPITIDKYKRTVARIYDGSADINLAMVKAGAAWAYRKYLTDDAILEAEIEAKNSRVGLWGLQADQIMPPWEWRHGGKKRNSSSPTTPSNSSMASPGPSCASKTVCGQMENCAEARFYLAHCGLAGLDGDRDGTPCEYLCLHPSRL